uniref:SH3 domain and tetratricopeptide repeat-containing protein 1 n=1 Tax=Euleptes europaea TaxID=460621 RepID=UPI002540FBD2|nr:SH3 domain and tetratricopeptide repeat-containing protein 1 [Euleptes europaea]
MKGTAPCYSLEVGGGASKTRVPPGLAPSDARPRAREWRASPTARTRWGRPLRYGSAGRAAQGRPGRAKGRLGDAPRRPAPPPGGFALSREGETPPGAGSPGQGSWSPPPTEERPPAAAPLRTDRPPAARPKPKPSSRRAAAGPSRRAPPQRQASLFCNHHVVQFWVLSLKLTLRKHKTGLPDAQLQGYLRERLRLLESDDSKARTMFSELSARLLSIDSEDYLIVVTFWTFEEIWKFETYYSLGFLKHCMENLLLDDHFWLFTQEEEEAAGIDVHLDEECLDMIYRDLLIQEGAFFVFHPENFISERRASDSGGKVYRLSWAAAERASQAAEWDALSRGLSKPLAPFHQWFLKANTDPADFAGESLLTGHGKIGPGDVAVGSSVAIASHTSSAPEEIGFQEGDRIEIIGCFMKSMRWFVGRKVPMGRIGFVLSTHVQPDAFNESLCQTCFEDELPFSPKEKALSEESLIKLLKQTLHEDVCNVYQIDGQEDSEFEQSIKQGASCLSLNANSCTMKYKVEQLLRRAADLSGEGRAEEKELLSAPDAEVPAVPQQLPFWVGQDAKTCQPEASDSLLLFLNRKGFETSFKNLYDHSLSFLQTLFHGYASEEDLTEYFGLVREAAKRAGLPWALARLCYLLGRMSLRKFKLSQARVYFEEALGTLKGDFADLYLVTTLYANLTGIYLMQKNKDKCACILDKAAALLMGVPNYISSTAAEAKILKYALKRAVLSHSRSAEARVCFLLAKHYLTFKQGEEALPFLERLQLLNQDMGCQESSLSMDGYFKLGQLYGQKRLPHLVLGCVQSASSCSSGTLPETFRSIDLVLKNGPPTGRKMPPSQIALFLRRMLPLLESSNKHGKLRGVICCSLSRLCSHHKLYRKAIDYMEKVLDKNVPASTEEMVAHLVFLSWLYILHRQNVVAVDILKAIIESSQSSCQQLGVAHNMLAIALKRLHDTKQAVASYSTALRVAQETGMIQNQAVALANLGILCRHSAAGSLGRHFLLKAVRVFFELPSVEWGRDFIEVLLRLGCCYANGECKEEARCCYEWAFLVAMETDHLEGQFQAVQHLCQFYSAVLPDEVQCVFYNEYQLSLLRKMPNKVMEGQVLETISQLYLSLGTERAYRSALEYTKRSLGLFIDLQAKAKEARAWLQAGKIYYMLRQNELVDLYIQVAQNAAVCTQDPNLEMDLFEASGDIFFNGDWDKGKALSFYKDKALPLAIKTRNRNAELRLCNKLVGLLLTLKAYEECLGYAQASLTLSVDLGMQLNERVAYHRLAVVHHHLGHSELAEHFYLKALSLCPSPLEYDEEALYYAQVYLVLGDIIFYELKDPFDASGYYNLALAAAMELGNKKAQLKIYTRLAIIYHNFLVDREVSLSYYQKARAFATELNIHRINLAPNQCHTRAAWALVKNVK